MIFFRIIIFWAILFLIDFQHCDAAENIKKSDTYENSEIIAYINSLSDSAQIILYAKELISRGIHFKKDKLEEAFNSIIPKIIDFEKENELIFFYLIIPLKNIEDYQGNIAESAAVDLKFEYKKSKKEVILRSEFIEITKNFIIPYFLPCLNFIFRR